MMLTIKQRFQKSYHWYLRKRWLLRPKYLYPTAPSNPRYSIGMVTYVARYEKFFRPVLRELTALFPDTRVTIAINGYYDQKRQREYLAEIRPLLASHPNVRSVEFMEGQSLSKLWNRLVLASPTEKTFIFNDDLLLLPDFRDSLERSGILEQEVGLVNRSWSHFLLSRATVQRVGWFDERFPGVGNEDQDYEARLAELGLQAPSFEVAGVRNFVHRTKDFSYGKKTAVTNVKYVRANWEFFQQKWEMSTQPAAGFTFVPFLQSHVRLRPGMQTPNFYPDAFAAAGPNL